ASRIARQTLPAHPRNRLLAVVSHLSGFRRRSSGARLLLRASSRFLTKRGGVRNEETRSHARRRVARGDPRAAWSRQRRTAVPRRMRWAEEGLRADGAGEVPTLADWAHPHLFSLTAAQARESL